MPTSSVVACPKCGHKFSVEEVLSHELEETIKARYDKQHEKALADFERQKGVLEKEAEGRLKSEREKLLKEAQKKAKADVQAEMEALNEEAETTRKQLQVLKKTQIENEKLKRQLEDQEQEIRLEFERKTTDMVKAETEKVRKREAEAVELKLKEKDKQLSDLHAQIEEMKRKSEQGSMQLQGEIQELALEDLLRSMFPDDLVEEVGKGVRGADVIQTVRNKSGRECGKILYESKRTKRFAEGWIEKLKADALLVKADVCVIVTEAMPEGMDSIGQMERVWICQYHNVKGLVLVLRESMLHFHELTVVQANKGDKMQMLYDYLTGPEFRMQLEAIVDGFRSLKAGYEDEKLKMNRLWKEREKQLEKVLLNTVGMYGSIRGIAGSSILEIPQLEDGDSVSEE